MADSLVLTGVKDVKKHTGTEMLLTRPKRGGDTHSLKEWWKVGPNKCYVMCTVFDVTTANGTVKLVLDSNAGTNLRIDHDGSFNFDFYGINEVRRGALFTSTYELIEHYVFPIISGGKVMTVTPAGGASRPNATPTDTAIGTVTISGVTAPVDSTIESYSVAVSGDATSLTYAWSVSGSGAASGGSTGSTFSVAYTGTTDASTVTCVVTSGDGTATDSPATGTLSIAIPTA
jgi:hypothetical protein